LAELIPASVGSGAIRKHFQNRTLRNWALLATSGLVVFYQKQLPVPANLRAAALGLIFPGAGFIACGNLSGWIGLAFVVILLPVTLFAVRSAPSSEFTSEYLSYSLVVWSWRPGLPSGALDPVSRWSILFR